MKNNYLNLLFSKKYCNFAPEMIRAGGMWAGLCLPFDPATIFQDIIKRRLLTLVLAIFEIW